jgi:uncharacterized protein (DUF58 family)
MDWPVTARTTVPHVRLTVADRRTRDLARRRSERQPGFGTATMLKRDLALAAAAAMTHLTVRGGNRVGAVIACGGTTVVKRPARSGRLAAQALLRTIARAPSTPGPALASALEALQRPVRRRGLAVVISDFLEPPGVWAWSLRRLAVRHEALAIELTDPARARPAERGRARSDRPGNGDRPLGTDSGSRAAATICVRGAGPSASGSRERYARRARATCA